MATLPRTVRRGLPRTPGGEPWPPVPADTAPVAAETSVGAAVLPSSVTEESAGGHPTSEVLAPIAERAGADGRPTAPASPAAEGGARRIRRGLPRVPGGEPWPPPGAAVPASVTVDAAAQVAAAESPQPQAAAVAASAAAPPAVVRAAAVAEPAPAAAPDGARPLRRGLPRVPGGDAWPPAGFAPTIAAGQGAEAAASRAATRHDATPEPVAVTEVAAAAATEPSIGHELTPARAPGTDLSVPLPFTRTVWAGQAARAPRQPKPEPSRIGPFTRLQWAGLVIVGGAGLLFAAGMAVLAVRFLLSTEPLQGFVAAYPGEYPLPEGAPVGIPPWLGWQHFFNTFLIVLIIRSGLQVRTEKRPSVFWSPRGNARRKISLNLWFHQSLDILWVTNGVIYVVLLFATGQWMKIVPTSWAVFPNAVSAALQYVSLDWPTENGWVNYNSLQQLAYFATVFIAAPLAIATGVRMSGIWPKNATALNKAYPIEWARAIHFPVMLYFVVFIITHVALVLATGALRNLNHMYASQDAVNWVGFWIFVASLGVITVGWFAARPLVLAPIARLFGNVSGR
jgi:thiosulfate reductase cytochrome b subunit